MRAIVMAAALAVAILPAKAADQDWSAALHPWTTQCEAKGCLTHTDVLRGESGYPPDAKDDREYVSVYVALNRKDRRAEFVSFLIDPRATPASGIFIGFTHSKSVDGKWTLETDKAAFTGLPFESCKQQYCSVRVTGGMIPETDKRGKIDLIEQFLNSNHLWLMYVRDGHPYRTLISLASFKKEYGRILEKEFVDQ